MSTITAAAIAPEAGHTHEAMRLDAFRAYVSNIVGRKKVRPSVCLYARYYSVEYLNAPSGLVILAHQDSDDAQVDGIHPAAIGKSVDNFRNIVEPLKGTSTDAPAYNVHYITRRSQGGLVREAFGRMIQQGGPEAPHVSTDKSFYLEIYNTRIGPIVGAVESFETVYVIRPADALILQKAA